MSIADSDEATESLTSDSVSSGLMHRLSRIPTPIIFLFSLALASLVLWQQGSVGDVGHVMRHVDPITLVAGMVLYLIGLALLSLRWHLVIVMVRGFSNLPRATEAFLTSVVINYAVPIGLAVPTRAALTKRALGLSATETGSVAIWEVGADVAVLGIGSVLWLAVDGRNADVLPNASHRAEILIGVALFALACLAALGILLLGKFVIAAERRARYVDKVRGFARTFIAFPRERPGAALRVITVTTIYWVGQGAVMWLLLRAVDIDPNWTLVLGLMSLPIVVGMLSPVPGGAGVREALMLAVADVHSTDKTAMLLAALTYRVALFVSIPILYGIVRIWLAMGAAAEPADRGKMAGTA